MRKAIFISVVFLLTIFQVNASENSCYKTLTLNNQYDSFAYSLQTDEIDVRDFGNDHVAQAISYVRVLLEEIGCSRADVNFGESESGRSRNRCDQIAENRPYSLSCYIETNLGYFFVTQDYLTTIHLIFNRWD